MHELSIATSLLESARRHVPEGAVLLSVKLRAGPLRGIDPLAMELAWQACTAGTDADGSTLEIVFPPWRLHCRTCGAEFASEHPYAACSCGSLHTHPVDGDQLQIVSIEVHDELEYVAGLSL